MQLTDAILKKIAVFQRNEITEHYIYTRIAGVTADPHNREVLYRIAAEELTHYTIWKQYTAKEIGPSMLRVWFYYLIARLLGMTFAIKLMEGVEQGAQAGDEALLAAVPEMPAMLANEAKHEWELIALIDEERLKYVGSVVLGLNDALVEFTGTLAGLTFAIQNSQIIAVAGLITGVAASLSMAASEYPLAAVRGDEWHEPQKGRTVYRSHVYCDRCPAHTAVSYPQKPVPCTCFYPYRRGSGHLCLYVLYFRRKGSSLLETVCRDGSHQSGYSGRILCDRAFDPRNAECKRMKVQYLIF